MPMTMDIFGDPAFTVSSMLKAMEERPYEPTGLAEYIGFEEESVATDTVWLEFKENHLDIIETTLRGSPIPMAEPEGKNARAFRIPRIAKGDKLWAHEIANMRPFDGDTEVELAATVIARKQDKLIGNVETTLEYHRLGALNNVVLDKNGVDVIYDFNEIFGITPPADIDLDLENMDQTLAQLRTKIEDQIIGPIEEAANAGNSPVFEVRALCSPSFFTALTTHPAVEKTYLNYSAASELRGNNRDAVFEFGGVRWKRYRGGMTGKIAIPAGKARIFPYGVPGMFRHILGPNNETFDTMHQLGRRYYPFLERDKSDKNQWVQPEIYAYPLLVNLRPDLMMTASK